MSPSTRLSLTVAVALTSVAVGAGIYEGVVVNPQWSHDPPRSFRMVQPTTGMPLQRFWMPLHALLTVALPAALVSSWGSSGRRTWIAVAIVSYLLMRAWSFAYFIPEMIAFQKVDLHAARTADLTARVRRWSRRTWLRLPLDVLSLFALVLASTLDA